ncbi:hypothetical protein COU89_01525 [Candidatus Roizmanbacteria bacterium CG10_big_fil_rev_8_21_14_0_10_45_7]|uniref:TNase-like domain-containing protein n=1 Tax=Candidatus Roizmanbacteria bacterium CG10_big_fil_rev_8_21_14_0_10_45_7 TaxID=1974854 RepID=A0A2M8KUZ8_9BACT|nr:MAG: hypothetical protein COU89_01525 [Candidatus Roizmanbacteria bacterium CG10_big_fil_rev_8_21_14_0_10_45_7]
MEDLLMTLATLLLVVGGFWGNGNPQTTRATRIIDGDTIVIEGKQHVRYIGVDTPEITHNTKGISECYGEEATAYNKKLIQNKELIVSKDASWKDRYGRLLRYVYVKQDGKRILVNEELIRQGYGSVLFIAPDIHKAPQLVLAQLDAMVHKRGMWKACP